MEPLDAPEPLAIETDPLVPNVLPPVDTPTAPPVPSLLAPAEMRMDPALAADDVSPALSEMEPLSAALEAPVTMPTLPDSPSCAEPVCREMLPLPWALAEPSLAPVSIETLPEESVELAPL